MGMAASQARFLQLTARRSNNEYMGQQINQARTALANKSAGLFEKMLSLKPPTPPSSVDDKYYTQGYTFIDEHDDLRKKITWEAFDDVSLADYSISNNLSCPYYSDATGTLANANISMGNMTGSEYIAAAGMDDDSLQAAIDADIEATEGMTDLEKQNYYSASGGSALRGVMGSLPDGFVLPEDAEDAVIRFVTLEHNAYDPEGNYTVVEEQMPALLFFDNRERLLSFNELEFSDSGSITLADYDPNYYDPGDPTNASQNFNGDGVTTVGAAGDPPDGPEDIASYTLAPGVSSSRVNMGDELAYSGQFDDAAFNDDMNRYEYDKAAYDYMIERINLETAQIQQQDKSLELKLKQIETDHKAIQTEMEAVQKVIQKNIETTFKTFA